MYNGVGLPSARGSGTNGCVESNKFHIRPKTTSKVAVNSSKGSEIGIGSDHQGVSKKQNKDILEHDRKRKIELKLAILEDKLMDHDYSDAEIAEKLKEARAALQEASFSEDDSNVMAANWD